MEHLSYEEKLRELLLISQERRLGGDLIMAFQYLKGACKKDGERLWTRAWSDRTRRDGFRLRVVALGRNQPLKKEKPKWKSDYPMTDGQLRSKRDEFWDTAPAFEGRKEIWDALKAAAHAFESNDHELAQAIIDGANITLPHGALTECYDELGNRYQLPVYCLAPPINMIEEKGDLETLDIPDPPPNSGHECQLRLRLSTGKDLKLMVRSMDTVYHMKRRLHAVEGVEPGSQRWFFSGRPLADKMKLEELKIPKDYVVQVIVSQPLANPTPVEN
ncbi:ubiquitin domain-containing protein 2 isoform X1 [Neopelma chrysocephalum]|uniref:ubiquitin domain-containing protein 2 isoform X1 n=1 Tax=Neopelma chrysocephalum TaxID=114329 RepID=UPI000FCD19D5|nr:ubiquitin domain-containing protein 2 isoform X1 [Neopelma chrysocephalum]